MNHTARFVRSWIEVDKVKSLSDVTRGRLLPDSHLEVTARIIITALSQVNIFLNRLHIALHLP
jgi:hypothetical protein